MYVFLWKIEKINFKKYRRMKSVFLGENKCSLHVFLGDVIIYL